MWAFVCRDSLPRRRPRPRAVRRTRRSRLPALDDQPASDLTTPPPRCSRSWLIGRTLPRWGSVDCGKCERLPNATAGAGRCGKSRDSRPRVSRQRSDQHLVESNASTVIMLTEISMSVINRCTPTGWLLPLLEPVLRCRGPSRPDRQSAVRPPFTSRGIGSIKSRTGRCGYAYSRSAGTLAGASGREKGDVGEGWRGARGGVAVAAAVVALAAPGGGGTTRPVHVGQRCHHDDHRRRDRVRHRNRPDRDGRVVRGPRGRIREGRCRRLRRRGRPRRRGRGQSRHRRGGDRVRIRSRQRRDHVGGWWHPVVGVGADRFTGPRRRPRPGCGVSGGAAFAWNAAANRFCLATPAGAWSDR